MSDMRGRLIAIVAIVALLVALLGGQAAADSLAPEGRAATGRLVGRAGFAYLSGIRTFVAAVLWNRLDPQFHGYYGAGSLADMEFMLPTIRLVLLLDPQFEQAYYVAPSVVVQNGHLETGLRLAEQGVEDNPDSGLLRASYAQMLAFHAGDVEEARRQADIAIDGDFSSTLDRHDAYALLVGVYFRAGDDERALGLKDELQRLDLELGDEIPEGQHDHDGDGKPDH